MLQTIKGEKEKSQKLNRQILGANERQGHKEITRTTDK